MEYKEEYLSEDDNPSGLRKVSKNLKGLPMGVPFIGQKIFTNVSIT